MVAASRDTYRVKGWAVFWTGVTTCVGFGSLVISEVPPVRMLGAWAAVGIAFMTLAALHLCPALLRQARDAPSTGWFWEGHAELWGRAWGGWAVRHRGRVIAAFTLFGLLWLLGLGGLEVRTNVLDYLPAQDPVRAELLALEARDIGVLTADLVLIRNSAEAGFDDPATLERLAELTQALRQEPLLLGVVGLPELADGVARYAETAAVNPRAAALAEVRGRPELAPVLGYFLTPKRARTRIVLWIPMRGFGELEPLFERARAQAQAAFPEAEVQLGGQYPLVLAAQRSLLRTMIGSLGLTLASVALLFVLLLRDRRQAGFALLANLWPVGFVLGAMGWFGVGLDSATVMIAAVVLGLAVDDSLHYLGSYRRLVLEQARGKAAVTGLEHTAGGTSSEFGDPGSRFRRLRSFQPGARRPVRGPVWACHSGCLGGGSAAGAGPVCGRRSEAGFRVGSE